MHADHLRDANEMRANLSIAENEYAAQQAAKQQALRDAHDEAYSAKCVSPPYNALGVSHAMKPYTH